MGDPAETSSSTSPTEEGGSPGCGFSDGADSEQAKNQKQQQKNRHNPYNVPLCPRQVRPQHGSTSYSPLQYLHTLLVKACGYTYGRAIDASIVTHLSAMQCRSIYEVKRAMIAIGCSHDDHCIAPAYAHAIGISTPEYDEGMVTDVLDHMEVMLAKFHEMKEQRRLPFSRKHEPHTGSTLRRLAHYLGYHGLEPAFTDLRPKHMRHTGEIIRSVFEALGWRYAEPCNGGGGSG